MPVAKLTEFLDNHGVDYAVMRHSTAFTALEVAESAHIAGKDMAKTVMVKIDGKMAMAVVPASYRVALNLLREASGGEVVSLASEAEFRDLFPNCEVGAMPPFGNLWNMDVYVAQSLSEDHEIAFSAGNHHEVIKLPFETFRRLVQPKIARISRRRLAWGSESEGSGTVEPDLPTTPVV